MAFFRCLRAVSSLSSQSQHAARFTEPHAISALAAPFLLGALRHMSSKLFVGGLAWELDDGTLRDAFSSFGDVAEAKVIVDRVTGRSRGFGFVMFHSEENAQNALAGMDGKLLGGRTIRVDYAHQKDPTARSYNRPRSPYGQQQYQYQQPPQEQQQHTPPTEPRHREEGDDLEQRHAYSPRAQASEGPSEEMLYRGEDSNDERAANHEGEGTSSSSR